MKSSEAINRDMHLRIVTHSMDSNDKDVHSPIAGSCLCMQVSYTVNFPAGSDYPPDPHTCQCTQCRKWSGAILVHLLGIPPKNITWTIDEDALKEYQSSTGCFRGFCSTCGSTLYWRSTFEIKDELEICTGTLNEEHLVGKEGKELCTPISGRFWCRREIPGVTSPEALYGGGASSIEAGQRLVEGSALGETMND